VARGQRDELFATAGEQNVWTGLANTSMSSPGLAVWTSIGSRRLGVSDRCRTNNSIVGVDEHGDLRGRRHETSRTILPLASITQTLEASKDTSIPA
jgi:hypothetical protein